MTTPNNSVRDTQIKIAYEVLVRDETGKTKKAIAEEFNISTRTLNRYFEKYEEEAMDLLTEKLPEENVQLEAAFEPKEAETEAPELNETQTAPTEIEEVATPQVKEEATPAKEKPKKETKPKAKTEAKTTKTRAPLERDEDGLTPNQRSILNTYLKQKASGNMEKNEDRQGKVGRAKKNIKTIRYIAMEIIEHHANNKTLTKENKDSIIEEIREAAATDIKTAKQYFSGHKLLFGDYVKTD